MIPPDLPKGWTWRHERGTVGRVCRVCKKWTPWDGLVADKAMSLGRSTICRPCDVTRYHRRYEKNPEAERERSRRYYEENREVVLEQQSRYNAENPGACQSCGEPCRRGRDFCRPCADARLPGVYAPGALAKAPDLASSPAYFYAFALGDEAEGFHGIKVGIYREGSSRLSAYRGQVLLGHVGPLPLRVVFEVEQAVLRLVREEGLQAETEVLRDGATEVVAWEALPLVDYALGLLQHWVDDDGGTEVFLALELHGYATWAGSKRGLAQGYDAVGLEEYVLAL